MQSCSSKRKSGGENLDNSWGKNPFILEEYGARAPRRDIEDMKTTRAMNGFGKSIKFNYDVLNPIMEYDCNETNIRSKYPYGPEEAIGLIYEM